MIKVRYGRTMRPTEFESERYEIEMDDEAMAFPEGTPPGTIINNLSFEAYRRVIAFEAAKGYMTTATAKAEIERMKKVFGIGE